MLVSPYNKPKIIPPAEHPRLLFRERDHRECGWGKVIISPRSAACEHHFRVRMEIMDAKM